MNFFKLFTNKIFTIGCSSNATEIEKSKVVMTNAMSYLALGFTLFTLFFNLFAGQYAIVYYDLLFCAVFAVPIFLNLFKKTISAQLVIILVLIIAITSGTRYLDYYSFFRFIIILPIYFIFTFFGDQKNWKFYVPLSLVFIFISVSEYQLIQNYNNQSAFEDIRVIYSFIGFWAFIIVFTISIWYFNSSLQKTDAELKRIKRTFDGAVDGYTIYDRDFNILNINKTQLVFSYNGDLQVGEKPYFFNHQQFQKIKETIEEEGRFSEVIHQKNANEENLFFQIDLFKIYDDFNQPHYVEIKRDITIRKKLEIDLLAREKNLKESNQMRDKLFSLISHDLRGPVGSIMYISELINEEDKPNYEDVLKIMRIINTTSSKTFNLLQNLLSWARIQQSKITAIPENIQLLSIFEDNKYSFKAQAFDKKIRIELDSDLSVQAFADKFMIDTVVRNLLSNAIKFCDENDSITLSASIQNNKVFVEVKDSGMGMTKETIDKILIDRKEFSIPGTRNEIGSGLGLEVCQEFLRLNQSELKITSIEHEGSSFSFELPLAK